MKRFEPRHVPSGRLARSRAYRRGAGLYGFLGNADGTHKPIRWWPRAFGAWRMKAGRYRIATRMAVAEVAEREAE